MGAIINVFSVPNVALTPTFSVNVGTATNTGSKSETYTFSGWCSVATGAGPQGSVAPGATMGSVASGNPGLTGITIIGAYSASQSGVTQTASYGVLVAGTISSGFTSMTVAGTLIGSSPTYSQAGLGAYTYVNWARIDATSLFTGGPITVVVT